METEDLNQYISKRHVKMVEKFNEDLEAFAKLTGDEEAELYEDAYTTFTLSNVRLENGELVYDWDGTEWREKEVEWFEGDELWEEEPGYYERETGDSIVEMLRYWRACLRRAKRYWTMDTEKLDAIQNGEIEDQDEEE